MRNRHFTIKKCIVCIIMAITILIVLLPIWMLLISSLLGEQEASVRIGQVFVVGSESYANYVAWVQYPTLRNYIQMLLDTPEFFVMFWNSMKQEILILSGQIIIGVPAAWAFAKYRFPLKRALFTLYTILMVLPFQVTMVSTYIVIDHIHLMNTLWAIVLPNLFATFSVFLMSKFFKEIPDELLDAARLDGASEWKLFTRIGLPLGIPGILSVIVLGFMEYWNNVEQPLAFLNNQRLWPLSLYLSNIDTQNIGLAMVAAVISLIPCILVFVAGQRYLEQGIAASGIKE